jgi:hypothetical protein
MFTEKWPYSDFHNLNLDWILETLKNQNKTIADFIVLNSITYADPLQWDITRQYPKNCVVLDTNGDGYLSVQPVPIGVDIENINYWTKIGNFSELWASVKFAITPADEKLKTTASANRNINDLVWLGADLYVIIKPMDAGTRYIEGTNCAKTSIAERLHYILSLAVAKYDASDTSISFGFFTPDTGEVVTGGDIHIYDKPVETIKIVGK